MLKARWGTVLCNACCCTYGSDGARAPGASRVEQQGDMGYLFVLRQCGDGSQLRPVCPTGASRDKSREEKA